MHLSRWFALGLMLTAAAAARAGDDEPVPLCFEDIGCVQDRVINRADAERLGCNQLWTARNGIFAARGYCFQTQRGIDEFGNEGCRYPVQENVPLNDYERENIRIIQSIEQRRHC